MDIEIRWEEPMRLKPRHPKKKKRGRPVKGKKFVNYGKVLKKIPKRPGLYIFLSKRQKKRSTEKVEKNSKARRYTYTPLYIGRAINLNDRIKGHITNADPSSHSNKLMGEVAESNGTIMVIFGAIEFKKNQTQRRTKILKIAEDALIDRAMAKSGGEHLLNNKMTRPRINTIDMSTFVSRASFGKQINVKAK